MNRTLVDARGMRCPMPLLKLKQALAVVNVGDEIGLKASDAGSWRDVPAFVELTDHKIVEQSEDAGEFWFLIVKGE